MQSTPLKSTSSRFTSPIFEILAGPDQKRFYAHADVLSKSESLRALIEGKWKDSLERKVVLEDWDEETVERLLEWLYTDDYACPHPTRPATEEAIQPAAPHKDDEDSSIDSSKPSEEDFLLPLDPPNVATQPEQAADFGPIRPTAVLLDLHKAFSPIDAKISGSAAFDNWATSLRSAAHEYDFEATLLAHAKLYALANYILLPALKTFALHRLQSVLLFLNPLKARTLPVRNLVTLAHYVYAHTDTLANSKEPLRNFLSMFIGSNFAGFEGQGVDALMEQGGNFVVDVCRKLQAACSRGGREVGQNDKEA